MKSPIAPRAQSAAPTHSPAPIDVVAGTLSPPTRHAAAVLRRLVVLGCALLLFLVVGTGSAQEESTEASATDAVAPFVSGLRVAVQDPRIRLTWRDPDENLSLNHIYRAETEITADTFDQAQEVGTVRPGTETFLDVPGEAGSYFYAVLSQTEEGEIREVFLPFRNKTTEAVAVTAADQEVEPPAELISLRVERRGDEVVLRFQADRAGRNLGIYRSTEPLQDLDALARSTRIDIVDSRRRSYTDFPVPGIAYHYAVLDTEVVAAGEVTFTPGENSSATAVELPLEVATVRRTMEEEQTTRRRPLPFLMLDETLRTGAALVGSPLRLTGERRPIDQETAEAVDAALAQARRRSADDGRDGGEPGPVVLKAERVTDAKGPRRTLKTIAEGPFSEGRWRESIALLENMLSIALPEQLEARVHFYLGQARYFAGEKRRAFLDFVLARDDYYLETSEWIDRIIGELHEESSS